jgi:hypothetical protein
MSRILPVIVLAMAAVSGNSQEPATALQGSVESSVYSSPTNAFKIALPVLPELGGRIRDTERVVMFQDTFGVQISIGAFPQDATQRWELSTRGIKDYLIYFFGAFVMADFKGCCPGAHIESAGFAADYLDGALFCYILLPGGSMFADQIAFSLPGKPPVAKRGNVVFVRNGLVFVVSTELAEKVTEGSTYKKTPDEEDKILRKRLVGIVAKMQFPKPPPAK